MQTIPFTIPFTYDLVTPAFTQVGRTFVKGNDTLSVVSDNGIHAIIKHFDGSYNVIENIDDNTLQVLTRNSIVAPNIMSRHDMLKIMSNADFRYVIENDIQYITMDGTEVLALYNETFTKHEAQNAMIQVWDNEGNTFEVNVASLKMI